MRWQLPKLASRRLLSIAAAIILSWTIFMLLLPSDATFRSLLRFNFGRASSYIHPGDQTWVFKADLYPVNFTDDVGLIIKTGYATQDRILALMDAMGLKRTQSDVLVLGDWGERLRDINKGITVDVQDGVERLLKDHAVADLLESERAVQYKELQTALSKQDYDRAEEISKEAGWHMDALKFIPGLELAHRRAPDKKWWVIMDDDTFLIKPSLEKVLSRLNPEKDHYVGNAIGDYKGRFAHGGSAIILSGHTVNRLFQYPKVVAEAKRESLTIEWGDKLVASALMKIGVYLDERFTPYFNGEDPHMTKISAETFCLPLVSFHGLGEEEQMRDTGARFKDQIRTFFRGELWTLYEQPEMKEFVEQPIRTDREYVGRLDESTTTLESISSAEECARSCDTVTSSCLAWTWEETTQKCHLAPFVVIGMEVKEGARGASGVHAARANVIGEKCQKAMQDAGCLTEGQGCPL